MLFQPTRPLRGATIGMRDCRFFDGISTHAPLAGRDQWGGVVVPPHFDFNPRAPCGARLSARRTAPPHARFQPTRPLRGATLHLARLQQALPYFNPRAPCGARPNAGNWTITDEGFQPTRPLRGATGLGPGPSSSRRFQPTRPLRGATRGCKSCSSQVRFQPTRPLRGATCAGCCRECLSKFQPTRPLRGATAINKANEIANLFQPTRPLRGATELLEIYDPIPEISTHAPLAGRDCRTPRSCAYTCRNFNPRTPCGARPMIQRAAK